jgi:chromosome segregation ATPase
MGNIIVKNHTFQNELTKLDRMLKEKGTKLELQMVEEDGGLFGWGNHKVTGSEFNKSIKEIQGNFININNALTKIHNEFRSVYNTFDTLDKEYIAGILSALIESEQASNDIKKTQEGLKNNGVRLERTVTTLVEFKKKITNEIDNLKNIVFQLDPTSTCDYKHLQDIDTIWTDVESHKKELQSLHSQLSNFIEKVSYETNNINDKVSALISYRKSLESLLHLKDVDDIWTDVESHKKELQSLHSQLSNFIEKVSYETNNINDKVSALISYRKSLESLLHLQDIDTIWTDVENLKVRLENAENSIFLNQIEIEKINSKILEIVESDKVRRTRVDKRINIAYWLTGTSLTMIVVNIVLQLLGIL